VFAPTPSSSVFGEMGCLADAGGGRSMDDRSVSTPHDRRNVSDLIEIGRDREAAARGSARRPTRTGRRTVADGEEPTMSVTTTRDDALAAVKEKQQATWASGNYAVIGTSLQIIGEQLCEAVDVSAGWAVLDVAAGNGNAALAAARRGCVVTASDYVPELLAGARRRAEADGVDLVTDVADAEALPYEDATFDAALSTVGVMFTPDPERSSAELIRVVRPGGRIGLASWTPEGFIGQMFKVVGSHVAPPAGVPSPLLWGTEAQIESLFGADCDVRTTRRMFAFRFRSAEDLFETFKVFYGPVLKAWAALDEAGQASFREQFIALAEANDRNEGEALTVDAEYLEVVATRR
jgi:SAM-dependent methyltransferase